MKYKNTGFFLESEEYLEDIKSKAYLLKHEYSGARLLYLENEDENKVFGIGFRTPPENSKGTPHILEHCVLNGSRKYKTKEPFMDLLKGSLQTFLNAMTFSDKTIYPVASRNDKDFENLMDVYLDAVFYPRIYDKKEIFLQEGWHYELQNPAEELRYKGVVYNEMRGAYSSPDSYVYKELDQALYPDSIYKNDSGGDPYEIPNLSYEEFLDFHRKYYHPSNSYIFLYGKLDLEEQLNHIEAYLMDFPAEKISSEIEKQPRFSERKTIEASYPLSPGEEEENKDYLIYAALTNDKKNRKESLTHSIVKAVLFSEESSPVKNALLKAGLGEDSMAVSTDGLEQGLGICAINTSKDRRDEFFDIIESSIRETVEKGFSKEELLASLNKIEFQLRECDNYATKGVIYMIQSLESWLYDEDPKSQFKFNDLLKELREAIDTDYYENFVKEKILNNPYKVLISLEAVEGLNTKRDQEVHNKLQKYKSSLSEGEILDIIEENQILEEMQNREDTAEEKETIPSLSLSDIEAKTVEIPTEILEKGSTTILLHDLFTQKIDYFTLAFNLDFIKEEEVETLSLMSDIIGLMDTKSYSYQRLGTEEYLYTGGIHSSLNSYFLEKEKNYTKKFLIHAKAKPEYLKEMFHLIDEMTRFTKFEDKKRFKEILQMIRLKLESGFLESGHQYALLRNRSNYSQQGAFEEKIGGLHYYDFIVDIENHFEEKSDQILDNLKILAHKVFNKNKLIINITTDEKDNALKASGNYLDVLPEEKLPVAELLFDLNPKNEGIKTSANINYVIQTGPLDFPEEYKGSYEVLSNILSNTYLYSFIRAQGGAYGTGMGISRNGRFALYSYRDPNIKKTLEIYKNLPEIIQGLELSEEEMETFIIGSLNKFDPPMTNATKGKLGLLLYITGQTPEDNRKAMEEAIESELKEFKSLIPELRKSLDENYITVIGNSDVIERDKEVFDLVRSLKN